MPRSMTAYGRHAADTPAGAVVWEIRSVNHRFLELQTRLPDALRGIEPAVRERVRARLARGRVELALRLGDEERAAPLALDEGRLDEVLAAIERLRGRLGELAPLDPLRLLDFPGVRRGAAADRAALERAALDALGPALDDLVAAREREGRATAETLTRITAALGALVAGVAAGREDVVRRLRARLLARLAALELAPDGARLEQELAFQAQRLDVDEELERLVGHLAAFDAALERDEPLGRRLDFLAQELAREANTLGVKAADAGAIDTVVEIKVLIEQLREQVQNGE